MYNKDIPSNSAWNTIISNITSGNISPVYLLYGEEEFILKQSLKQLTSLLVPEENKEFNLEYFDPSTKTAGDIIDFADTYPFLSGRKILVIEDYPYLSGSALKSKSNTLFDAFDMFSQGDKKNSLLLLFSLIDLSLEDIENISKYDFINSINDASSEPLSKQQDETVSNMYLFLAENIDELAETDSSDRTTDQIEQYLDNCQSDFSCFIFITIGSVSKRSSLYKLISKKGEIIEFENSKSNTDLYLNKLISELALQNIKILPSAVAKLKEKAGTHLRQIYKEVDKIINYLGDKKVITDADVDLLVSRTESEKIYELTDALAEKNINKSLLTLSRLFQDQVYPLQIIAGVITKFRFLLQVKLLIEEGLLTPTKSYPHFSKQIYPEIKKTTIEYLPSDKRYNIIKQHPFVVFKSIQQALKFSLTDLEKISNKLLSTDLKLKFSSSSPKRLFELLILEIC